MEYIEDMVEIIPLYSEKQKTEPEKIYQYRLKQEIEARLAYTENFKIFLCLTSNRKFLWKLEFE